MVEVVKRKFIQREKEWMFSFEEPRNESQKNKMLKSEKLQVLEIL